MQPTAPQMALLIVDVAAGVLLTAILHWAAINSAKRHIRHWRDAWALMILVQAYVAADIMGFELALVEPIVAAAATLFSHLDHRRNFRA